MSENFKYGWILARKDFANNRMMFVWSTIFVLYMSGILGLLFYTGTLAGKNHFLQSSTTDFIMLICAPLLGTDFSRRAFHLQKEDTYTKNLVYLRILPVSSTAIIWGRVQQMALIFLYNWTLFFSILYISRIRFEVDISFISYIAFALTWAGFCITLISVYLYFEFSLSGKNYIKFTFIVIFVLILLSIGSVWLDWNITNTFLLVAMKYKLASPLMWSSIGIGIVCMMLSIYGIRRTLRHRDLV